VKIIDELWRLKIQMNDLFEFVDLMIDLIVRNGAIIEENVLSEI
jgi:hypothetical protein